MSASELKVGDKVEWDGRRCEVKAVYNSDPRGPMASVRFDDDGCFEIVRCVNLTPIPPQPEAVRIEIAFDKHGAVVDAALYGGVLTVPRFGSHKVLDIDLSTGRVVADEPWVEKAEAQLQNMHRHVDDLTNDQIRQAIEAVVGMFPAPREAEDNKQQCRLPRDLEPTDPQWLRRAVAGGEAWASDPDLDDITLPSDEQLKEWGVKVVGFRVTRPGDRYLWGNALRVDTSVCEGACKRLIVADAEADAESDDTAARVERLETALKTIAGGMTSQFPGAPNPMQVGSPLAFRAAMWEWSQRVAQDALTAAERGAQEAEDEQ